VELASDFLFRGDQRTELEVGRSVGGGGDEDLEERGREGGREGGRESECVVFLLRAREVRFSPNHSSSERENRKLGRKKKGGRKKGTEGRKREGGREGGREGLPDDPTS